MFSPLSHCSFVSRRLSRDSSIRLLIRILLSVFAIGVVFFAFVGVLGTLFGIHVYLEDYPHAQTWKEYAFTIVGGLDAAVRTDTCSVLYSMAVRLLAALFVGGLVTSLFCAIAERIADLKLRGLLPPVLREHSVIVGYDSSSNDIIRMLLAPSPDQMDLTRWNPSLNPLRLNRRRVLLCTSNDVASLRDELASSLPASIFKKVSLVHADIHASGKAADELFQSLSIRHARQVFLLGDAADPDQSSTANLALARRMAGFLSRRHRSAGTIPIYVKLQAGTPFAFWRDLIPIDIASPHNNPPPVHLVPFGIEEDWARRIWGSVDSSSNFALDFSTLAKNRHVRLVIAGLSRYGEALLLEAIRICHFANGGMTRIMVVDPDPLARERFLSCHASLAADILPDIKIEWREDRIESASVRDELRKWALDGDILLTIAICFSGDDGALSAALSLPEEVYWHVLPAKPKSIRDQYRKDGPHIWVRQARNGGPAECVSANPKYANLRSFGMQEDGLLGLTFHESGAMYLNAVYAWPSTSFLDRAAAQCPSLASRIVTFRRTWQDALSNPNGVFDIPASERIALLVAVLSEGGSELHRQFQIEAFHAWLKLAPVLRRANNYVPDSWGTLLRALGLHAERSNVAPAELIVQNDRVFRKTLSNFHPERPLAEVEHNRWMADRVLLGYRPPRPGSGEVRDDDYLYHHDLVPFDNLSAAEVGKDDMSLLSIPILLAFIGFRLKNHEAADDKGNDR